MRLLNFLSAVAAFCFSTAVAQQFPPSQTPCGRNFGGCHRKNGLCWGTSESSHFCSCKAGYERDKESARHICIDIDECAVGNFCPSNSICENTEGSYRCHCICGYIKDYTGEHCLPAFEIEGICSLPTHCVSISGRRSSPVPFRIRFSHHDYISDMSNMRMKTKIPISTNRDTCSCESGFQRNLCGFCEDIDECAEGTHACSGPGSVCENIEGGYYCTCLDQFRICGRTCYSIDEELPDSCEIPEEVKGSIVEESESTSEPWPLMCQNTGSESFDSADLDDDGFLDVFFRMLCNTWGKSEVESTEETEAEWDEWTCWSACKPTCWGGLQTRTRRCKHGVVGAGCIGRASESKECYFGTKCPFRVRKDATKLSQVEINDLLQAMERFKEDTSTAGFHNTASSHGWPFQCNNLECCPHGAKLKFLAWHRSTVLNYEMGLTRYLEDKTLGLPYWNWLAEDRRPPILAWNAEMQGRSNPFTNMTVRVDLDGPMRTIQRDPEVDMVTMNRTYGDWIEVTESLMKPNTMHEFSESLEAIHGDPHVAVCQSSDCEISMGSLMFAGFDPLFMFHHTQIDRLWAVFQKKLDDDGMTAWTVDTAIETGESLTDFGRPHMPFGNDTINSYPIMKAVNNMRDSYYYKELTGVVYDYLDNNGLPSNEKEIEHKFQSILIAHYLKSFGGRDPVYVNYYEALPNARCDLLSEELHIGSDIMLPTTRPFRNVVPTLIATKLRDFLSPNSDMYVKACYTNLPRCLSQCPEASNTGLQDMPSPGLLKRTENSELEVFKFNWSPGNIMPDWRINFMTDSNFIYFYGSRADSVYQVSTASEWQNCDLSQAKPLHCPPKTRCLLPVGVYFILDQDFRLCQQGLRMIAVSRN